MSDLSLEIHHLDTHGGDSTAIIVKDLGQEPDMGGKTIYSMLIDAGAEGQGSAYLQAYLKQHQMGPFNCIVATHYHQDHIQGFSCAGIEFERFLDNGGYSHESGKTFTPPNNIGKGSHTNIFDAYQGRVRSQVKHRQAERIEIPFIGKDGGLPQDEPVMLKLGENTGITLRCYCANGILANGRNILKEQKAQKNKAITPNDVSLACVLEWGDFRYMTAGDLSGDHTFSSYYNIEESLVEYLTTGPLKGKPITVFKASHHGSEHSNHDDLLKGLQPDTIIVSCNLQKQVPSPVFLQRLATYFGAQKSAQVVFTNTMKVFKNDDRYNPLERIKANIAKHNVAFTNEKGEEVASNLGIKCAIIRRRVKNGTQVDYEKKPGPAGVNIINKRGYDIVLMPRDKDEAEKIEATVKFRSYDIKKSWQDAECSREQIQNGFESQAKAMIAWIDADKSQVDKLGRPYIELHYPGILNTIENSDEGNMKDSLVTKMLDMFNNSFVHRDDRFFAANPANKLTSDEKLTISNLLINNSHQVDFNTAISPGTITRRGSTKKPFNPNSAWNVSTAPEPSAGGGTKRALENQPEGRDAKRQKPA